MPAIKGGKIVASDVVVIRYEGAKGGPGMRDAQSDFRNCRYGSWFFRCTDYGRTFLRCFPWCFDWTRFTGAAVGGPIALVEEGRHH